MADNVDDLRRTKLSVQLNNVDITEDVNKHLISAVFTDVEDGESDDLQLTMEDSDHKILGVWLNTEVEKRAKDSGSATKYECKYAEPKKTLKKGAEGEGVKWIQWHLNKAINANLSVNGKFSASVVTALKEFQKSEDMTQSGMCNANDRKALKESIKEINTEMAGKKAKLSLTITQVNDANDGKSVSLCCGNFEMDDVSGGGPPEVITIKGTACSYSSGIRTKKYTRAWNNTNLKKIATSIGKKSGYTIMYLPSKQVKYKKRNQSNKTDIQFLQKLCTAAGFSLKVTDNTIVIFDQQTKESAADKRKFTRGDGTYISYRYGTSLSNTAYSACHVKYESTSGKKIEYTYVPPGGKKNDKTILEVSDEEVSSKDEAKEVAIAKLRAANKGETTMSFVCPGDVTLCAGNTVSTKGFGPFDGKYIIEKATHNISVAGFTTSIDLRKVITGY